MQGTTISQNSSASRTLPGAPAIAQTMVAIIQPNISMIPIIATTRRIVPPILYIIHSASHSLVPELSEAHLTSQN